MGCFIAETTKILDNSPVAEINVTAGTLAFAEGLNGSAIFRGIN